MNTGEKKKILFLVRFYFGGVLVTNLHKTVVPLIKKTDFEICGEEWMTCKGIPSHAEGMLLAST